MFAMGVSHTTAQTMNEITIIRVTGTQDAEAKEGLVTWDEQSG